MVVVAVTGLLERLERRLRAADVARLERLADLVEHLSKRAVAAVRLVALDLAERVVSLLGRLQVARAAVFDRSGQRRLRTVGPTRIPARFPGLGHFPVGRAG